MRNKTIFMLLGAVVILAGVIGLRSFRPWEQSEQEGYKQSGAVDLSPTGVEGIELTKGTASLRFAKGDKGWESDGYRINAELVDDFLTGLLAPTNVELIAEAKERHAAFGLTETERTMAKLSGAGKSIIYYLGEADGSARYINREGQDVVYLISGIGGQELKVQDWVDLQLARFEQGQLDRVTIEGPSINLALQQTTDGWFREGSPKKLETSSLAGMLTTLESLAAQELAVDDDALKKLSTQKPTLSVRVTTKNGRTTTYLFKKLDDDYYLESSDGKGTFVTSNSTYNNFATVKPAESF